MSSFIWTIIVAQAASSSPEQKDSPPVFIVCGYKDRPDISQGMAEVYLKFKQVGVPAELHIYAGAGHGFGLRDKNTDAAGKWPARFEEWLGDMGFLPKP